MPLKDITVMLQITLNIWPGWVLGLIIEIYNNVIYRPSKELSTLKIYCGNITSVISLPIYKLPGLGAINIHRGQSIKFVVKIWNLSLVILKIHVKVSVFYRPAFEIRIIFTKNQFLQPTSLSFGLLDAHTPCRLTLKHLDDVTV